MRKFIFLAIAILIFLLTLSAGAKEVVVYENDFSSETLSDFNLNGNWKVENGKLVSTYGSGSAFLTYTIPEIYVGCDYKIDVDFLAHTSTGGIEIGATCNSLSAVPELFFGFSCFTGNAGNKAALGYYDENGSWKGNISVSDANIPLGDLHLSVYVSGKMLIYTVSSLDKKEIFYGIEYTLEQVPENDIYSAFSNVVGLRKFYKDEGAFDNFRITCYTHDVLPDLSEKVEFNGVSFVSSGLTKQDSGVNGNGVMLTENNIEANFTVSVMLSPENASKFLFGMTDEKNGYAFAVNKKDETVELYQIKDGIYSRLGRKQMPIKNGEYLTVVSVNEQVATLTFDAFSQGDAAFPSFEMYLADYAAGNFGIWLEGGNVNGINFESSTPKSGQTYLNPVTSGADPDVLYYNGTYYLYNAVPKGNSRFSVHTSPDLVHWTDRGSVFSHNPTEYVTSSYMSPNVFYYDGTFYLFYAASNADGEKRIYYATASSPLGPFEHKNGQIPLHDASEIGGHPYLDESGKIYMTFVRFGNGNHIWIEEVTMKDCVVTPVEGTLTKVISPTQPYEIDGYGHISEGGVIHKHGGYYYMIYASGHYKGNYGEAYAVADKILGPYTKYAYNEILTFNNAVTGVGDGIFVSSPDGSELWMVYHQHDPVKGYKSRLTCIDKVQFVKDPNGGPDILTVNGPSTTAQAVPSFTNRYDIDNSKNLNINDVISHVNILLSTNEYIGRYDINSDGKNNITDALYIMKKLVI